MRDWINPKKPWLGRHEVPGTPPTPRPAPIPLAPGLKHHFPLESFDARPCDRQNRRPFTYAKLGDDEPGQWSIDSEGVLYQRCPKCAARQRLKYHSVDVHGIVEASVGCANTSCDFHEMIRLEGWPHAEFKEAGVSTVASTGGRLPGQDRP
jgi:hypothetical protein